ncbi:DUF2768 family protein [Paenibacillus cremeus]|uniref:DUF2768 family protein n=1 Tax=Paenibacillus cremeus TaxID=2163881 RepID=UPI0037038B29
MLTSMDKMWASFIAIGLMIAASVLISFARSKTTGVVRVLLSLVAFLMFIPILLYMIVSMF